MSINWSLPIVHRNGTPCSHEGIEPGSNLHMVWRARPNSEFGILTMVNDDGIAQPAASGWDVLQA